MDTKLVPPLILAVHLNHAVYFWGKREGEAEKERVYVFVLKQKGVLLPQDVAFKAEEVGFLWRKRSQNRQGLVKTPCSNTFLEYRSPRCRAGSELLWNKVGVTA